MRHRVKEYDIIAPYAIDIAGNVTIEDIRLIVNETQGVVICSSMQKGNIVAISTGSESTTLSINPSVCTLNTDDILTIEIDKGDTLSSVESKVEEVGNKIDNIKLPEIDTTNIASKDLERFFGVKPIEGYEFMTAEEVCSTLEEIMTIMDLGLTPEQAKEITNNTLNKG